MLTHKYIKERCECILGNKYDKDVLTNAYPDIEIRIDNAEFESLWFEVESSNFPRPSEIASSIASACRSGSMIKFAVPTEDQGRVDYYANRIDNILCPPHLMRSSQSEYLYKLYKQDSCFSDDNGNIPLIPKGCDTGDWYYDARKNEIQYVNRDYGFKIKSPDKNLLLNDLNRYYDVGNNNLVRGSSQDSVPLETALTDNKRIPAPFYPQSVPRTQLQKTIDNVEYLIVGENVTYKREHPNIKPLNVI